MRPNLLDFTPDGQAIINMPNYKDISFLDNFGFSPIECVEQEVTQADCPERAAFLEHYIRMYKETFTTPPNSYLKEIDIIPGQEIFLKALERTSPSPVYELNNNMITE